MPIRTPPPDPDTGTPRLKCPPGSVDCHIHMFGPAEKYAFVATSKYVSDDALPETYFAMQDKLGLSRAVLVSGAGYGTDTRHLTDVLSRYPDRLRGVTYLTEEVTRGEIERLHTLGVRGVRFLDGAHGGSLPTLSARVAAMVAEFGWHVVYYPHRTNILDTSENVLAMSNDIVLDHFGHIPAEGGIEQPAFKRMLKMIDTGRVWVKISGPMRCTQEEPPYPSMTPFAHKLGAHAPERILWGTDWPHTNMIGRTMPNDAMLVDLLLDWVPDEAVRDRVLVDNPVSLYGF